ncbi:MAG: hypothetical protein MJE77_35405 [Proteobacteria bacterium]|nr:hypothetical protein [Pseudomonadota bacterium]
MARHMRNFIAVVAFPVLALLAVATPVVPVGQAFAQAVSSGSYAVTFEAISNSCEEVGLRLTNGTLQLTRKGKMVEVDIPGVPSMKGKLRRGSTFRAEARQARAGAEGIRGRFSAAGRASDKRVQLVFVAEFYRGKKPLCTQSWDVIGTRQPGTRRQ